MIYLGFFDNFCDWCICWWAFLWLLPFLLGLLLGWTLWSKWRRMYDDAQDEIRGYKKTIADLEAKLEACKKARMELESDLSLAKGRNGELSASIAGLEADLSKANANLSLAANNNSGGDLNNANAEIAKLKANIADLEAKLKACGDARANAESDLAACKEARTKLESDLAAQKDKGSNLTASMAAPATGAALGLTAEPKAETAPPAAPKLDKYAKLKEDNLQIIEGIGPKMNEVLVSKGITSWSVLASKTPTEVKAILDTYGDKYRIIDPAEWPDQAAFAAKGDWDGLIAFQKSDGSDSKAEKLMVKMGILKAWAQDDLKAIEGIGPKTAELLNNSGIKTWRDLANAEVSNLQKILDDAGDKFKLSDPGTWPKQAEMAADGLWDELEKYQDFLDGGKTPS